MNVKNVIFGATYAGLAAAMNAPTDTLVVDSCLQVGYEFTDSFRCAVAPDLSTADILARSFLGEARERNMLDIAGYPHSIQLSGLLAEWSIRQGVHLLLLSHVIEIVKNDHSFSVTLFNTQGSQTIETERIIDTTMPCIDRDKCVCPAISKSLCCLIKATDDPLCEARADAGYASNKTRLLQNRPCGMRVLEMDLPMATDWQNARSRLLNFWFNRPKTLRHDRLVHIATTFAYRLHQANDTLSQSIWGGVKISDNWHWIPSAVQPDLFSAFARGAACLKRT
jgi:hypothetical protein